MTELLLRLYVAGQSPTSRRAEKNLLRLQRSKRIGRQKIRIEIIDVLKAPELAEQAAVIATPTLSFEHAVRPRRVVGDLNDVERVLEFLGIVTDEESA